MRSFYDGDFLILKVNKSSKFLQLKLKKLHCGNKKGKNKEQTHPNKDEDEHGNKVVCSRDRILVGQTEEIHDGGTHPQYTLDFISWRLVCIDALNLGLCRRPGSFLQVNLQPGSFSKSSAFKVPVSLKYLPSLVTENMLKNRYIFIPLGSEELYDLLSQLLRVAGYVHGKACVCVEGGERKTPGFKTTVRERNLSNNNTHQLTFTATTVYKVL